MCYNTGAMARGYKAAPYPHKRLLHILKKHGARLTVTSDCHGADKLDFAFDETWAILKDVGFDCVYALYNGEWTKDNIIKF